jgi:tetratricopeptide (TPR) repeat protein
VLLVNRGLVRYQRGHLDEAAADYREAIRSKADPYLAHAELAHVYQKQDKPAEAIAELTRAIALNPDWPPLYRGRAEVLMTRPDASPEDRKAALADLETAIRDEQPDNPVLAKDHTDRGRLLYREERLAEALAESQLALGIAPDYPDAHVLKVQVLLKLRRYDEVIHSCNAALEKGKKSPLLYELRGLALAAGNDYAGAIRDYSRALEIRPDDGGLLVQRGWAYLVVNSPQLALGDFDAAIKLHPADGDAFNGRGTARVRLGDHRAAVADARAALRLGKANPGVTYKAARIFAMAASVAASDPVEKTRVTRLLASQYEDMAVRLARKAMELESPEKRMSFWKDTIQTDPALKVIRRRLRFDDLLAAQKKTGS